VEEKNIRLEGKKGWSTYDGKNSDVRRSDSKRSEFKEVNDNGEKPFKKGAIDKAKLLKLLNDDLDCSSDTSDEEGQWQSEKGKRESSKRKKKKLKSVTSKVVGSKGVQLKDSKKKDPKQNGNDQHSLSSSRTHYSSMSGSKGRKSEVFNETIYQSKLDECHRPQGPCPLLV